MLEKVLRQSCAFGDDKGLLQDTGEAPIAPTIGISPFHR